MAGRQIVVDMLHVTSGIVGPNHCMYLTSHGQEMFDGLVFQRCSLLSLAVFLSPCRGVYFDEVAGLGIL